LLNVVAIVYVMYIFQSGITNHVQGVNKEKFSTTQLFLIQLSYQCGNAKDMIYSCMVEAALIVPPILII